MAIVQSQMAKGVEIAPQAFTKGAVVAYRASFTIPTGTNIGAGDILELAVLPADHEFVTASLIPEGDFATVTADVGIMTGQVGSLDPSRTVGQEVFAGAELTGLSSVDTTAPFLIEKSDTDRSIGVKFSAALNGDNQTITLLVVMTQ